MKFMSHESFATLPDHALQRLRVAAPAPARIATRSVAGRSATRFPPAMQVPRRSGAALSLGWLGSTMRLSIFSVLCVALLTGCGPSAAVKPFDIAKARDVPIEVLERETRHLPQFYYWGRADGFDYFGTPAGTVYRLPESISWLRSEQTWSPGKAALYVTFRDGRITVPAAKISK